MVRLLREALNGLMTANGYGVKNGHSIINGQLLSSSGGPSTVVGWNVYFRPEKYSVDVLKGNWIDSNLLGLDGVGNLSSLPGIQENIIDNRFIPDDLKTMYVKEMMTDLTFVSISHS
jgi:hypothetical protein